MLKTPHLPPDKEADPGWRRARVTPSLAEVYKTVPITGATGGEKMGVFANPIWLKILAYVIALIIAGLNIWLLLQFFLGV